MESDNRKTRFNGGLLVRAVLPLLILVTGWFGFTRLSVEVEKDSRVVAKKRNLRTQVEEIVTSDYPVTVETHGIVQAHNQVTLAAEILRHRDSSQPVV